MPQIERVSRKELTANEVIDIVEAGGRVVIDLSVIGATMQLVIRKSDGVYYCDTPMKLMSHEDPDDLRACLEQFRLVRQDPVDEAETVSATA